MDPNETLRLLRQAIEQGRTKDEIVGLFEALDEWLTKGGFPPSDWNGEAR